MTTDDKKKSTFGDRQAMKPGDVVIIKKGNPQPPSPKK